MGIATSSNEKLTRWIRRQGVPADGVQLAQYNTGTAESPSISTTEIIQAPARTRRMTSSRAPFPVQPDQRLRESVAQLTSIVLKESQKCGAWSSS